MGAGNSGRNAPGGFKAEYILKASARLMS